nr:glucose dehydrogenase [FAD, quinone]-like isoform X2 [Leptinotarsa decemlineata]XP_023022041.1 glucose dehydrogenase [FAD, quinone]-like isoform X2 [Leptinotarsa decemlineata]
MGKIVGGTGMLNNMIYVRGHSEDFNDWFKNKEGYSFENDILPYFTKLERGNSEGLHRGSIFFGNPTFTSKLANVILEAAKTLGFTISSNTEDCKIGFGLPKKNIRNGERWTPSHTLIHLNKPNLFLRTNRVVEKVIFHENFEARGVQYRYSNKHYFAKASKGVILSAGVVGTPKILLLSGIGPKTHLDEVHITSKINLPVGENLQDHITTGFDLIMLNQTLGIGIEQMLSPYSAFNYFWNGAGPWTFSGCEVLAFCDVNLDVTDQNDHIRPDIQLMVMPLSLNEDSGVHLRQLIGITDTTWHNYFAKWNHTAITILPILLHPKSRGTVRLKDSNFESKPLIDPNYLSHQDDIDVLLKGIELIKKIANTKEMKMLGAKLNENVIPGCNDYTFGTNLYWECYIRHLTITTYHPVGTCKMGREEDSTTVVNYEFEVKGTNNLFIVDGSILPSLPSGNVNGAILTLAEMASDRLKLRHFLSVGKCRNLEIFLKPSFCHTY